MGYPEDRFSHVEAHLQMILTFCINPNHNAKIAAVVGA